MIKRFKENERAQIVLGVGIFSVLWILAVLFAGEISFIDTITLFTSEMFPPAFNIILPFVFVTLLCIVAVFSKRHGLKRFYKSAYLVTVIPMAAGALALVASAASEHFIYGFEFAQWLYTITETALSIYMVCSMFVAIPFSSSVVAFGNGVDFYAEILVCQVYAAMFYIGLAIYFFGVILSMLCYDLVEEKQSGDVKMQIKNGGNK